MKEGFVKNDSGTVELVVLGLLAALILVLALPLISDIGAPNPNLHKTSGAQIIR